MRTYADWMKEDQQEQVYKAAGETLALRMKVGPDFNQDGKSFLNNEKGRKIGMEMKDKSGTEIAMRVLSDMALGRLFTYSVLEGEKEGIVFPSTLSKERYQYAVHKVAPFFSNTNDDYPPAIKK